MTRFNMKLEEAVEMVLWSIKNNKGGEIFVPKLPSYKILDLAKSIDQKCKIQIVGIRPGEKIEEKLITSAESLNCYDLKKYFAIIGVQDKNLKNYYYKNFKKVKQGFSYSSGKNKDFLKINTLKKIIKDFEKK